MAEILRQLLMLQEQTWGKTIVECEVDLSPNCDVYCCNVREGKGIYFVGQRIDVKKIVNNILRDDGRLS